MNSKETRRNRTTFETTMRAVLQWFGFAAFLFSASLLFLKMGFYELSVSSTCSRDVSSSYKVVEMEVTCVLSQVISLLMPNPCGRGKNLCLISPTLKTRGEPPLSASKEMFEKCNFFDEKLNDIDCSVERDTRDYVGKNHSLAVRKKTDDVCLRSTHCKIGHGPGVGGSLRHDHLCYCLATR